jgi:hypothetical protein
VTPLIDLLTEGLRSAREAINPPDLGGISLHDWNQRLKAATVKIDALLLMAAEDTSMSDEGRVVVDARAFDLAHGLIPLPSTPIAKGGRGQLSPPDVGLTAPESKE